MPILETVVAAVALAKTIAEIKMVHGEIPEYAEALKELAATMERVRRMIIVIKKHFEMDHAAGGRTRWIPETGTAMFLIQSIEQSERQLHDKMKAAKDGYSRIFRAAFGMGTIQTLEEALDKQETEAKQAVQIIHGELVEKKERNMILNSLGCGALLLAAATTPLTWPLALAGSAALTGGRLLYEKTTYDPIERDAPDEGNDRRGGTGDISLRKRPARLRTLMDSDDWDDDNSFRRMRPTRVTVDDPWPNRVNRRRSSMFDT